MKKNLFFLVCILSFSSTQVFAVQGESVNFTETNPILKALLDEVIHNDSLVESLEPRFDENFSNLEKERLKYDLNGKLKNTPWSPGQVVQVEATSTYQVDRQLTHGGILAKAATTIHTDTLKLFKYAAHLALRNQLQIEEVQPSEQPSNERFTQILQKVSQAQSLEDVYDGILQGRELTIEQALNHMDLQKQVFQEVRQTVDSYPSRNVRFANAIRKIEEYRRIQEGAQSTQISLIEAQDSKEIHISSPIPHFFFQKHATSPQSARAYVMISPKTLFASAEVFFPQKAQDLDQLKADINTKLLGVQNGVPAQRRWVHDTYRKALIKFKRIIHKGNTDERLDEEL